MKKAVLYLLTVVLMVAAGCRKSENVISEEPEKEVFLIDEKLPKDIYLYDQSDPNNIYRYVPTDKVSPRDLYSIYHIKIIKPDTSKEYTMIIIPADPSCDPGIFVPKIPQPTPKQNVRKK